MLGERMRQRRLEKNISLAELARRAGLSKGYLHAIETGRAENPSASILHNLASELGTTIEDLLGEGHRQIQNDIPPVLLEFARQAGLTESDVRMLAGIQYRGKQPENAEDWWFIFEAIKRTLR